MESPKLDKTSPTYKTPEGQGVPQAGDTLSHEMHSTAQESEIGVTQPMSIEQKEHVMESQLVNPTAELSQPDRSKAQSISETQPSILNDEGIVIPPDIPDLPPEAPKGRRTWLLWVFLAVLVLVLIAGGSAFAGYNSAIDQRTHYQSTLVAGEAANQYVLAQQDIALGNYDRARQRLEYIIKLDPNYPNASEQLAFVLTQQRITATPTFVPTPTLTPTPDYRSRDDLFSEAQNLLIGRDWNGTIDTLLLLRKNYPDYMAVKVDDMLFVALRNRGIDKIAQLHDLEGGNYDLTLAERFGPLDSEARNWRDWADLYIRGASFWDVDWAQAVYYFSQLASAAPNLSDTSGWTASNRYMDALLGYGDWFASHEQWCDAQAQYDTYMALLASSQVEPTAIYATDKCTQASNPQPPPVTPGTPSTPSTPTTETPTPTATLPAGTTPYP
jgi:tetratricopeptide (TPR) repeat protein